MQRSDGDAELIDGGGVDLGEGHAQGVIAGLLDAGNVRSAITGLDALGVVAEIGEELIPAHIGSLGGDGGRDVVLILLEDRSPEIGSGGVLSKLKAPVGSAGGNGVALGVVAVGNAEVHDGLREGRAGLVQALPESSLGGFVPVGEVGVVLAGFQKQLVQALHAGAILFHTHDGQREERAVAVIGRVGQRVHREDDVVRGELLAIGEHDVVAQIEIIGDSAVIVFGDGQISDAVVGVIGAVVGTGLTGLALFNDCALTVSLKQSDRGHGGNILVISRLRKERRELTREVGVTHDQRLVGSGAAVATLGAAGEQRQAHQKCQNER